MSMSNEGHKKNSGKRQASGFSGVLCRCLADVSGIRQYRNAVQ
jgi:hypothetical protein